MSTQEDKPWHVEFYTTSHGHCPPLDYIENVTTAERAKIAKFISLLEKLGTRISMPHARPLVGHKPLWELRPMPSRLIYVAFQEKRLIVLHAFSKKKGDTPKEAIKLAEQRYHEFLERED